MNDDAEYLSTKLDAAKADGRAAAVLLESVATTLRDAPDGYRCDISLKVRERDEGGQ